MHEYLILLAHSVLLRATVTGAVTGLLAAAVVDFHAFLTWKSADEALSYNWRIAGFRWFQGLVAGALTAAGLFSAS